MRSDAQSNRARILVAAAEVLASPGDTSLQSIANRASVGKGTLYRHFPSREFLVFEVYGAEVDELVGTVLALLASYSPPLALSTWLDSLFRLGRNAPELAGAMKGAAVALMEQRDEPYRPLLKALSALVDANEAAGTIVPGTTPEDILLLLGPLWHIGTGAGDRVKAERLLGVLMRGLCPSAAAGGPTGPQDPRHAAVRCG
ncbi:TetR/AcrR family transcriptional regulator [Streptomyces dioscori]|uniref:TetR/AcrR family transcriptional regulator n=1 Tax=Streptomyces dioscori TaxID=2109333 RepID=A0A2P8Q9I8_9ACTN|nr:TetR/AcrR family transcriptional regulator [Streptomyces dioscori]PSM42917.1 TetR/AcrR family transcriptional regulator [Streptomyces dioscori]